MRAALMTGKKARMPICKHLRRNYALQRSHAWLIVSFGYVLLTVTIFVLLSARTKEELTVKYGW